MNKILRARFLAGVLVTVPVVATALALRFLFRTLDSFLGPAVAELVGRRVPGLGLLATLVLIFAVGVVATHWIGRRLIETWERVIGGLPLVRMIYGASKEIVSTATLSNRLAFREVVIVEYPRRGLWSYGFLTSRSSRFDGDGEHRIANVFIPGPPVPTTGALVAVPEEELFVLDLSVEEALKLVLTGGMVAPSELRRRPGGHGGEAKA